MQPPAATSAGGNALINLRYTDAARIHVRGPVSGRTYEFSAAQPFQAVDPRDAASLLQTGLFRRG